MYCWYWRKTLASLKSCNELWVPKIYLSPGDVCANRLPTKTQIYKLVNQWENSAYRTQIDWNQLVMIEMFLENETFTYFMEMFCSGNLLTLKIINNINFKSHCQKFSIYSVFFFFYSVLFFFLSFYVSLFIYWVYKRIRGIKTLQ